MSRQVSCAENFQLEVLSSSNSMCTKIILKWSQCNDSVNNVNVRIRLFDQEYILWSASSFSSSHYLSMETNIRVGFRSMIAWNTLVGLRSRTCNIQVFIRSSSPSCPEISESREYSKLRIYQLAHCRTAEGPRTLLAATTD